jgi:hypothetical protein
MKLTTDLFLVTYPKDYLWLEYLFKSILRYVKGFRRLVIVTENQDRPPFEQLEWYGPPNWFTQTCRNYRNTDYPGYTGQAVEKLRAWHYTDADRIFILDSDLVFTRPVDLETDPRANVQKPIIVNRPWEEAGEAVCWHPSTVELLGNAPFETMCCHPFIFPGWLLHRLWEVLGGEAKLLKDPPRDARGVPTISDFNVMGNYGLKFPEAFTTYYHKDETIPQNFIHQFWSHHTVDHPEVQAQLKSMGFIEP